MRVLYVIEGIGGGAVTHVLTIAEELSKLQIQTITAFISPGPSVTLARNKGLEHTLIPSRAFPDVSLIWKLSRLICQQKIDIVHTHTIRGNFYGRIGALLSARSTICLTTVHSFLIDELAGSIKVGIKEKLLYKREVLTWRFVDHFIAVSEKLRQKLQEEGIRDKLTVITHGIRLPDLTSDSLSRNHIRSEFKMPPGVTVVGIIGRLVPVKNHKLFLKAAQNVLQSTSSVRFMVVGDGYMKDELEHFARALNIGDSVVFTGWRNDVDDYFKAIDILVLCSTTESQGLVILEAMSCEKPVIATDINETGETVINGRTGILIPSNDLNALARAILELIRNKELAKRFGHEGRLFVQREYSLPAMVNKTATLYKAIYGKRKKRY